jgi:hypothetical protein
MPASGRSVREWCVKRSWTPRAYSSLQLTSAKSLKEMVPEIGLEQSVQVVDISCTLTVAPSRIPEKRPLSKFPQPAGWVCLWP